MLWLILLIWAQFVISRRLFFFFPGYEIKPELRGSWLAPATWGCYSWRSLTSAMALTWAVLLWADISLALRPLPFTNSNYLLELNIEGSWQTSRISTRNSFPLKIRLKNNTSFPKSMLCGWMYKYLHQVG